MPKYAEMGKHQISSCQESGKKICVRSVRFIKLVGRKGFMAFHFSTSDFLWKGSSEFYMFTLLFLIRGLWNCTLPQIVQTKAEAWKKSWNVAKKFFLSVRQGKLEENRPEKREAIAFSRILRPLKVSCENLEISF